MDSLVARLKKLANLGLGVALALGLGAVVTAKSLVAQALIVLLAGVAIALTRLLDAAGGQFAAEVEEVKEEVSRARTKQLDAMREQKELRERWDQMEFFSDLLKAVASLKDVDSVLLAVLERLAKFLGAKEAFVMLVDEQQGDLYVKQSVAAEGGEPLPIGSRIKWGEGVSGRVALTGKAVLQGPAVAGQANKPSLMCVPLTIESRCIGCLMLDGRKRNYFGEHDLELTKLIGQEVGLAIERAQLYSRMEELSITDPLTKLSNRRYLEERMTEEMARSQRHQRPLSVTMLDIDHFKSVNDTHGHAMGDSVLKGVAKLIREEARTTDIPARYGGEEFMLVSPDTPAEEAVVLAERLRERIESCAFEGEGENEGTVLHVTISMGVAAAPTDAHDKQALVERADAALYHAKESGRNRVCQAADLPPDTALV